MNIQNINHCPENLVNNGDTVTTDDVAALAYSIGVDIWGEEQFMKMISSVQATDNTIYFLSTSCSPSFAKPLKRRNKKESS